MDTSRALEIGLYNALQEFELEIYKSMEKYTKAEIARRLRLKRTTVHERMKKLGYRHKDPCKFCQVHDTINHG